MVSITPTPSQNTGSPLCALSIRLTGLLFCQCTGPDPFSAVYIIKHTLQSSFLHRGLEMLSPLPRYTVTTKIFHKLDWNWQFRIQRWRLVRRLVGVWRVQGSGGSQDQERTVEVIEQDDLLVLALSGEPLEGMSLVSESEQRKYGGWSLGVQGAICGDQHASPLL